MPKIKSEQLALIRRDTVEEGYTQTELGILDECGFKWHLMYNWRLSGSDPQWYYAVGAAWHQIMENLYRSGGETFRPYRVILESYVDTTPEVQALQEQWEKILEVYAEEYVGYFGHKGEFASLQVDGIEQIQDLTIEWKGQKIRLKGMVDLKGRRYSKRQITDHKTFRTMNDALTQGWQFRFQFMFYRWLNRELTGEKERVDFVVNGMRKPSIKVKKSESLPGYLQRLRGEIRTKPTDYFFRETLMLNEGRMKRFEEEVLAPKLNKIALIQQPPSNDVLSALVLNKNTEACINKITGVYCPFFQICEKGTNPDRFTRREHKHPELAGE